MPLRTSPSRSAFFVGTRRTQSELAEIALPPLGDEQCAFLESELATAAGGEKVQANRTAGL